MKKITFVISDETRNSYGFVTITAGINTEMFERNPVMFYMHDRDKGIIGRWENIRKENKKLLADAVFDDTTEFGRQIKTQVEKGFLRCASIGIDNAVVEVLNGIQTAVKCDLREVSIVDIPANRNAVRLYNKNGRLVKNLSDLDTPDEESLLTQLFSLLKIDRNTVDPDTLEALKLMLKSSNKVGLADEVERSVFLGLIEESQRENFYNMAVSNEAAFRLFVEAKRRDMYPEIIKIVDDAISVGKLFPVDKELFIKLGEQLGINTFKQLIGAIIPQILVTDIIKASENPNGKTLADYRKYSPEDLRNNRQLYAELLANDGKIQEKNKSLDWYRKNDPDYLMENPDVYKRLIDSEK